MKSRLTLFLAAAAITLAVVCAVQSRKSTLQQAHLVSLRGDLDEKAQQLAAMQTVQEHSKQQRQELLAQSDQLATQLQALQQTGTKATALAPTSPPSVSDGQKPQDAKKGGFGEILSKIMQDPDTRQLVRGTQRMMMDQLYAPLIGKMALTPDEAARFKDLLADNMMNAADKASSMFGGLASTDRTNMLTALTADQKNFDEQLKAFLGEARYAQYKDYQETAAERMQLNAFKQQAGSDYTLNDQQTEALLTIMKEEQKNVGASMGLPLGSAQADPARFQALLSEDKMAELLQAQQTIGQQVYERARSILSPDQLEAFGRFQTNQLQMMRMGMNMARKMFAPDQEAVGTVPPN